MGLEPGRIIVKVLIFEIKPHHFEIIPGFVSLFLQLEYEVDCLLQDAGSYGDVFCRCEEIKKQIRVYNYTSESVLDRLLELQRKNKYGIVFFSSIEEKCQEAAQLLKQTNTKLAGCCHVFNDADRETFPYFDGRIVTLSETTNPYGHFPEVNANRFCDDEQESRKHKNSTVICVGASNDHYKLAKAVEKTGIHLTLIRKRYTIIHLIKYLLIRCFKLNKHDWKRYRPIIKGSGIEVTGRIPFPEMFSRIEASDFIAINMYESVMDEFSSSRTTGSKQLSLGFLKPCIIEKSMADYYGFDETNAVVYEKGEFAEALERAVGMSREEYGDMVAELKKLRDKVRRESLENLRLVLEK